MKLLLAFLKFLIKNTNLQIGTVVAQCTTKTTYLKKAIYFFSIMSYSTNQLKFYILFSSKSFVFFNFTKKKKSAEFVVSILLPTISIVCTSESPSFVKSLTGTFQD